jgi:hypothetical protein
MGGLTTLNTFELKYGRGTRDEDENEDGDEDADD